MTDYSKMSDIEINNLVFDAIQEAPPALLWGKSRRYLDFCNSLADAWPIIEKYRISIINLDEDEWGARGVAYCKSKRAIHENPLRAAMIVFLMMQENQNG